MTDEVLDEAARRELHQEFDRLFRAAEVRLVARRLSAMMPELEKLARCIAEHKARRGVSPEVVP